MHPLTRLLLPACFLAGAAAVLFVAFRRAHRRPSPRSEPRGRLDERTTMFSRAELVPGSERFTAYYADHPGHRAGDDAWRRAPGLLRPGTRYWHPLAFPAAEASFAAIEPLHAVVDGAPASRRREVDPAAAARFLKGWLRHLGAVDVGVTRLRPEHVYAVGGRRERYGQRLVHDLPRAIAFTVEMDHAMVAAAPQASTVMESALQYHRAAGLAVQAALWIRSLGYRARAHIDGDYLVVCPLVARDAGLGEIGRMGLLMTPRLGPRVRLGVVTTDLPLPVDAPTHDPSVLDFCAICRKCADACPAGAIPAGPRAPVDGVPRWRIDQQACYAFWCRAGTDCARCVAVCPYSHPDTWWHRLVRAGVRRSHLLRRLALWGDDLVYGRRPRVRRPPGWLAEEIKTTGGPPS